ncbi:MAG: hypothetical protein LBD33_00090 [Puniceicoccales bacterium]|jgi:hypothetical protein|nr:hypothetical protein [Puniceicoccales bacterium]
MVTDINKFGSPKIAGTIGTKIAIAKAGGVQTTATGNSNIATSKTAAPGSFNIASVKAGNGNSKTAAATGSSSIASSSPETISS